MATSRAPTTVCFCSQPEPPAGPHSCPVPAECVTSLAPATMLPAWSLAAEDPNSPSSLCRPRTVLTENRTVPMLRIPVA